MLSSTVLIKYDSSPSVPVVKPGLLSTEMHLQHFRPGVITGTVEGTAFLLRYSLAHMCVLAADLGVWHHTTLVCLQTELHLRSGGEILVQMSNIYA